MRLIFSVILLIATASANPVAALQAPPDRSLLQPDSTTDSQMQRPERPNTEASRAEAKANPGGWVYEIGGGFSNSEAVPPQAIKGAWKVDARGEITDEYRPNPNYDPAFKKPGS
ncbi:MAG: hypothetical protein Q7J28_07765 [Caulobacter sp.]|nr:hypothetical protein [Caulobacter sp.]